MKYIALFVLFLLVIAAVIFAVRVVTNVTTSITENDMGDGVVCYMATSSDGVAISCIKKD